MLQLIFSYLFICFVLGCNAISYKINIDDEFEGALSGRFYHFPAVKFLMTIFYLLSVFLILGLAISLAFKMEWYYALLLFLGGYSIVFQFLSKRLFYLVGSDSLYFSGIFTLFAIPTSLIYYLIFYLI